MAVVVEPKIPRVVLDKMRAGVGPTLNQTTLGNPQETIDRLVERSGEIVNERGKSLIEMIRSKLKGYKFY